MSEVCSLLCDAAEGLLVNGVAGGVCAGFSSFLMFEVPEAAALAEEVSDADKCDAIVVVADLVGTESGWETGMLNRNQ